MEQIAELSSDVHDQCQRTKSAEETVRCLANQNWSLGRTVERLERRVDELEKESLSAKDTIDKLHFDLCKLNIHVIKVQEKLKDVESKNGLTEMHIHAHNDSLDDFSQRLDVAEETLERCGACWDSYDRDQRWNTILCHSISQQVRAHREHLRILDIQTEIIEDYLRLESHCSHCPRPDGVETRELERRPSGYSRRDLGNWRLSEEEMEAQIREDEEFVRREMGELEGEGEIPYYQAPPASVSPVEDEGLLRPITPSTSGSESDNSSRPSLESVTTADPENAVAIPVVRGSLRSGRRYSPYGSPPASSSSRIVRPNHEHRLVERLATYPGWGLVTEFVSA